MHYSTQTVYCNTLMDNFYDSFMVFSNLESPIQCSFVVSCFFLSFWGLLGESQVFGMA